MSSLEQALKGSAGKSIPDPAPASPVPSEAPKARVKSPSRQGKEYVGAWLNPDFGTSLRMVQLRRRKDPQGKKIYLDDLMAEALNDLFAKYDVPTVHHE
ncbi:MAG TPA: ribbon-helix-helix domain-containing protein [Phycisphaerae bacterium]|jgi:hypothetical protein|nr:ribbon-helix-helix domain-containing protein [Phycisphaerae bacterium]